MNEPTLEQAKSIQKVVNHFDALLFEGELPPAMVTATRNSNVIGGYMAADQWINENSDSVAEIGINSNVIAEGDPVNIYGILIHELLHLSQHSKKTSGRDGYHNKDFAKECDRIGLKIVNHDKDAQPDQRTGQNIGTEILHNGLAAKVIAEMEFDFEYWTTKMLDIDSKGRPKEQTIPIPQETPSPKRSGSRTKYTCPICGLNAWAKSGVLLVCGADMNPLIEAV